MGLPRVPIVEKRRRGCAELSSVETPSREREQLGCQPGLPSQSKAVTCHVTLGMHLALSGQAKKKQGEMYSLCMYSYIMQVSLISQGSVMMKAHLHMTCRRQQHYAMCSCTLLALLAARA